MKPITIAILGQTDYDLTQLKDWFRDRGLYNLYFTFTQVDTPPVWKQYVANGLKYVDENWFDLNMGHLGGKADIVLWLISDWPANHPYYGYARPEQRLGQWRTYVRDADRSTISTIKIENRILRVMAHEICHLLYPACGAEDETHELDYSGQSDELLLDVEFSRFKHFTVKDGTRFFYRNGDKIEERIVYSSIAKLFASGYNYWRRVFGFTDTIPPPNK